jgi:Domain of unknown function (DUF4034)
MGPIAAFLYDSKPGEFRSDFDLNESVSRLQAATRRPSPWQALVAEQAAVGTVTASKVRLQRVVPALRNSFKPFFVGRFEQRSDAVYLTGHFSMLWSVKLFMTCWLGAVLLISVPFLITAAAYPYAGAWSRLLIPGLMLVGGIAMVAFGKRQSRDDPAWLSAVITNALQTAPVRQTLTQQNPAQPDPFADEKRRAILQWSALVLLGLVVLGLWLRHLNPLERLTESVGVARSPFPADMQPLRWLKAADYAALDRYYTQLQEQFEHRSLSDLQLYAEFRKLYQDDPENATRFDQWVRDYPRSYAARVAQGAYYYRMAWAVRGEHFVSQTPPLRLYLMEIYLGEATSILRASLPLSPRPYLSALYLLNVAMLHGKREDSRRWLDAGTFLDPDASLVRIRYMVTLQPRWGGSVEQMRAYAVECAREHVAPKTLAALKLDIAYEVAYAEASSAGPTRRMEIFSEILTEAQAAGSGPQPMALAGLARADWDLMRRADADRALAQIDPAQVEDAWTLSQMGFVYAKEQRMPEAWRVLLKAARLGDAWSQFAIGKTYIDGCAEIHLRPDRATGLRWIRLAAAQGYPDAIAYLASRQGIMVPAHET